MSIQNRQFYRNKIGGCQGLERGEGRVTADGYEISSWG